jgi:hypothetical protein
MECAALPRCEGAALVWGTLCADPDGPLDARRVAPKFLQKSENDPYGIEFRRDGWKSHPDMVLPRVFSVVPTGLFVSRIFTQDYVLG